MKKLFALVLMMAFVVASFSSCADFKLFRAADSLLVPPLFYEEYEGLVELFRSQIGENASLCTPYDGDYRSAIVVEDFDSDGVKEAFIFYRESMGDTTAKARCYESIDGEWKPAGDFIGHGNQVESVTVSDMNGDGISEIIVSWSVSGVNIGKTLSVYHTSGNNVAFKEISNEVCSVSLITDIDGDSLDDIFMITQNTNSTIPQRNARIISVSKDSAVLKGEARVDANISSYVSVKTEKTKGASVPRIYIDALKGERQMITELIYWDSVKKKLVAPLFDESMMSTVITLRNDPILSADINGDGIIDVPSQTEVFSSGTDEIKIDPSHLYVTSWLNFYDGGNETVVSALVNYENGYMITLSGKDRFELSVEELIESNCWVVKERNFETGEETELYSVIRVSTDKINSVALDGYVALIEKEEYSVYVHISPYGAEKGLNEDVLKNKILPLQQVV
ncbi:MAG: VCBS repeat-containing protein [Clostridia bacterium]|nr:VCBS repeat-containing protein [Clostridia bacterium]